MTHRLGFAPRQFIKRGWTRPRYLLFPKFATLIDPFDTSANWQLIFASVSGGTLTLVGDKDGSSAVSTGFFDLTGSKVAIEINSITPTSQPGAEFAMEVTSLLGPQDKAEIRKSPSGNIEFISFASGVQTVLATVAHNTTTMRWWQIREAGGTIYLETAPDGTTWTTQASYSVAGNPWMTRSKLRLGAGQDNYPTDVGAYTVEIAAVNVLASYAAANQLMFF